MTSVTALYLVLLAGVAGYVLVARVPSILHTPMMSGSNFIHGIVLAGAMLALGGASTLLEQVIGFIAVAAAAANVVGGFVVTDRMLALFDKSAIKNNNFAGAKSLRVDGTREKTGSASSDADSASEKS
ncbi:MAG: NAD(P) transhydrogenase subunit alpha [bacterium]|jgi:NAD(P) transhydrogenase subunit alpha